MIDWIAYTNFRRWEHRVSSSDIHDNFLTLNEKNNMEDFFEILTKATKPPMSKGAEAALFGLSICEDTQESKIGYLRMCDKISTLMKENPTHSPTDIINMIHDE